MIAECEVMPPASVANASTWLKSSSATVEGQMFSATITMFWSSLDEVELRVARKYRKQPRRDVFDVGSALAQVDIFHLFVRAYHAVRDIAHGPFGVDAARAYVLLDLANQAFVFEHQQVRVEYV